MSILRGEKWMTGNRRKIDTTPTFDAFNIHLRQTAAFTERIAANAGDRVWNGDARQAAADTVSITNYLSALSLLNGRKVKP